MEIYRFSNWPFSYFKQFRHFANFILQFTIDSHFFNFMHVTIDQSLLLWAGYGCFTEYGQDFRPHKTIRSFSVWQQIQESHIDLSKVIFIDSISMSQELITPVNKQTLKAQSFISFCNTFSDLCHKIKYAW